MQRLPVTVQGLLNNHFNCKCPLLCPLQLWFAGMHHCIGLGLHDEMQSTWHFTCKIGLRLVHMEPHMREHSCKTYICSAVQGPNICGPVSMAEAAVKGEEAVEHLQVAHTPEK